MRFRMLPAANAGSKGILGVLREEMLRGTLKLSLHHFTSGMSEAIFQRRIAKGETKIEMTISREIMTTNSKSK
jgi:hypothetical protein